MDRDYHRVDFFINELHQAEQTGVWPQFMIMSLGENHTEGLAGRSYSPVAHVASNDLGVGKLVEAVSRSKFWPETAIFVIEDDAQNGPDHVDAHRTVGLVISPWVKRHALDSTMYTTASMVRTMELILKLPAMTQFDDLATPMYNSFTSAAGPGSSRSAAGDSRSGGPQSGRRARRQRIAQDGLFGFRPRRSRRIESHSVGSAQTRQRDAGAGPQCPAGLAIADWPSGTRFAAPAAPCYVRAVAPYPAIDASNGAGAIGPPWPPAAG